MHFLWKKCPHGRSVMTSPEWYSSKQMQQVSSASAGVGDLDGNRTACRLVILFVLRPDRIIRCCRRYTTNIAKSRTAQAAAAAMVVKYCGHSGKESGVNVAIVVFGASIKVAPTSFATKTDGMWMVSSSPAIITKGPTAMSNMMAALKPASWAFFT